MIYFSAIINNFADFAWSNDVKLIENFMNEWNCLSFNLKKTQFWLMNFFSNFSLWHLTFDLQNICLQSQYFRLFTLIALWHIGHLPISLRVNMRRRKPTKKSISLKIGEVTGGYWPNDIGLENPSIVYVLEFTFFCL